MPRQLTETEALEYLIQYLGKLAPRAPADSYAQTAIKVMQSFARKHLEHVRDNRI